MTQTQRLTLPICRVQQNREKRVSGRGWEENFRKKDKNFPGSLSRQGIKTSEKKKKKESRAFEHDQLQLPVVKRNIRHALISDFYFSLKHYLL
jgi:hypothetical protein